MFTGIIREVGLLKRKISRGAEGISLEIISKKIRPKIGDSIAVNGVCLTASKKKPSGFIADIVPETIKRTNLRNLPENAPVNLEPSIKAGETLDGHLVMGHVDAVGTLIEKSAAKVGFVMTIKAPHTLQKFIAEKGSISINGVSLTVTGIKKNIFSVAIVPFTELNTNLGKLAPGTDLNIEIDIIARYLDRLSNPSA